MRSIQVGDGMGSPVEWENPIQWKYIIGECREFLRDRAAYCDRVAVACRRVIYAFKLSPRVETVDLNNVSEEHKERLALQYLLLQEHVLALKMFNMPIPDREKHGDTFPRILGIIGAMLDNLGMHATNDMPTRQKHRCLQDDPIGKVSHTFTCGKMTVAPFRSPHTLILQVRMLDDEARQYFVGSIEPFRLKSLVADVNKRRISFKDTTVLWIAQDQDDSDAYNICLRNTRDISEVTNKGLQKYQTTTIDWTKRQYDVFIRNCEIAEKTFEQRYLGEDSQKEDKVLDGLV